MYVPGYGCSSAKLLVLGEAPGAHEEEEGLPFVGPAGNILDEILEDAGIRRSDVYITNVVKIRPPNNKISDLKLIGHSIEEFIPQLTEELNTINPNCILALGNTALQALTGFKGIEKYRGSILRCALTGHKVVASLHPASLLHEMHGEMRSWRDLAFMKVDAKRAAEQSLFHEIRLPDRTLEIAKNSLDVYRFFQSYAGPATIDVETFKAVPVCIAIAFNSWHALSIPLHTFPYNDRAYAWKLISEFLRTGKLIAQNGKFDTKRCRDIGLKCGGLWFDTMLGWHTLFPEFPKKLEFISSIITEEPYYKDEGREFDYRKDKIEKLLLYNCKDAVVEFECYEKIYKMLEEEDLLDFFFDKVMPLHDLYSTMEDVGILVDETIRKYLKDKYKGLWDGKYKELIDLIVENDETVRDTFKKFNVNSPKQVNSLLYGYLRCPPRKDSQEETLKALSNNAIKDVRRKSIIKLILEGRKITKTVGTYLNAKVSDDGRIRTEMMIVGTESGRTSTQVRKAPVVVDKEGMALQTMTKHEDITLGAGGADLRSMFIADSGYTFLEADGSQAEDRVVCVLAEDWDALKEYERKDFKRNKNGLKDDRHTKTAMMVCSMSFEEITDYYRQIGKRTRHAGNYAMGKHEGMLTMAKYGIFVSEWKMGKLLEAFLSNNPNIKGVFHAKIQKALVDNDCVLVNPFERKRQFFNKWGDQLFKEAYAQIPQSTVTDQTKFALLRIWKRFKKYNGFFPQLESHDSFLAIVEDEMLDEVKAVTKEEMEKPINFKKCTLSHDYDLVIPCEIKTGKRWIERSDEFPDGMK